MFYDFITKYTDDFVEKKMREAFALQKASHIFSTKNIGVCQTLTFEILMKRELTMSLVLNRQGPGI